MSKKRKLRRDRFDIFLSTIFLSFSACLAAMIAPRAAGEMFEWQKAVPENEGMSSAKLDALKDALAAKQTRALLVIRNDKIVYEWYAEGQSAKNRQGTASLAKAIVGG